MGFPGGSDGKESTCNAGDLSLIPGSERSPWSGEWVLTPVFLPGESHGQRSLVSYRPCGHKELDTTEQHIGFILYHLDLRSEINISLISGTKKLVARVRPSVLTDSREE